VTAKERRTYFRIRMPARVAIRPVEETSLAEARLRVRSRHVAPPIAPGSLEETRIPPESRATLDVLQRIAITLERIDRRLDDLILVQNDPDAKSQIAGDPVVISLSASGFSGPFDLDLESGTAVEVTLDLTEGGIPSIPALARIVRSTRTTPQPITALRFIHILPDDRERIVQLSLRRQSQDLRERRMGEE
jgi:hypothetical protein